jgi:hypothetical protein
MSAIQLTPAQQSDVDRTAKSLRDMGAISATLSMIGFGPLVVWANGSVSQDMFATQPPADEPMTVGHVETLVAVEWDSRHLGLDELVARLRKYAGEAAVLVVTTELRSDGRTEHRIEFDTGLIRNTDAHGIGYRCGFVVNVES